MTTTRKRSLDFLDNGEQTIVHSPVSYTPPVSPGAEKRFKGRRGSLQSAHSYREESYRDEGNGWSRSGTPTGSPPRDVQRVDEEEELHQDREQSPPRDQDREREREQSPSVDRELDHEQDQSLSRNLTYSPGFDPSSTQTLEPEYDMDPNPTQTQTQAHGPEYDRSPSHSPPHSPSHTPTHEPESTAPPCAQPEPTSKTPSPPPPAPASKQSPSPPPSPPPAPPTPPALAAPNQQQQEQPLAAPATPKTPPTPPTDDLLLQLPPHDWPSFLARFTSTLQSVGDEKERIARELDMWNWMYEIWSTSRDRDDTRRLSREMATMVQWTKMKEAELERAREEHTESMLAISSVLGIAPKSGTPPARR